MKKIICAFVVGAILTVGITYYVSTRYDEKTQEALDNLWAQYQFRMDKIKDYKLEYIGPEGAMYTGLYLRARCSIIYSHGYGVAKGCMPYFVEKIQ